MDITRLFIFFLGAFLCVSPIQGATVSENFVVTISSNVTVHSHNKAILPCWLSPQQSAEEMEVKWFYQNQFDAPVMLYKDKALNSASQLASYTGRVSFGQKDASSGGLKDGDVSLNLVNVTLADAGEYTCYVSSDTHHSRASFNLIVRQTGVVPLLTAIVKDKNTVNMSCESSGWYPKPKLQWSDGSSALTPEALVYNEALSGLMSVHSWLHVPISSEVSCSVGLFEETVLKGKTRVETPSQAQEVSRLLVAGWMLFAVTAVALIAFLGFTCLKKYTGEPEKFLPMDLSSVLKESKYVNVQLEKSDNKFIMIKDNKLRDACSNCIDSNKITCLTAVRGMPGFSSGKHYWEVSLVIDGNAKVSSKKSWWIGVTNKSVDPNLNSPCADKGFWFLSSSHNNPGILVFSSNPATFFGVSELPTRIGVYLDYDGGNLGFYNTVNKSLIGFFHTRFSGKVFPLFNPGEGDRAPMELIQRAQDDEPGEENKLLTVVTE